MERGGGLAHFLRKGTPRSFGRMTSAASLTSALASEGGAQHMIGAWRGGSPVIRGTFMKLEGSPSLGALSSTKGHAAVLVVSGLCFGAAALPVFARPTTAQV